MFNKTSMGLAALTFLSTRGAAAVQLTNQDNEWNSDISAIQTDARIAKHHRHH